MKHYIIGIDTGGTYTDGVLIDTSSGTVIQTAKARTTHHQLAKGTTLVLKRLLAEADISPTEVQSVAISTTLATNSVVENKGARVGVFVIGYVKHFKLPVKAISYIKGGHTITGEEEEPLDINFLVGEIEGFRQEVDAYAICSAMSMKNPTHELVAEKALTMMDPDKPVFLSHTISQQAGMQERAATAGLHAKLMPVMANFIDGVEKALSQEDLHCPLMVISGNGTTITADEAVNLAGITVASGPACTAHFGALHSTGDQLVIDIGGTTTDIALLEQGAPTINRDGGQIGDWKTHVESIDMFTGGIGGDSHVHLDTKGVLHIGPSRVVPLSMSDTLPPIANWLGSGGRSRCIGVLPGAEDYDGGELLSFLVDQGPATPEDIRQETGLGGIPLDKKLESLARRQLLFETGFTPTDALHVLGMITLGDSTRAHEGAAILAKAMGKSPEQFCRQVLAETEEKIENLIVDYIIRRYWGTTLTAFVATRNQHPVLGVDFSVKIPLIGIGAAARHLLPNVASNLGTTVVFPDHCEVGNAIGAAMIVLNS